MTIQKKLPDRVDIFNNNSNEQMSNSFEGLVKKDVEDLSKFLTLEKVNEIINESYNFVDQEGTNDLSLNQFRRLLDEVLPRAYMSSFQSKRIIGNIYKVFTGAAGEEEKPEDISPRLS